VFTYGDARAGQRPCRFLMGNHEALMKDAIDHKTEIPLWLYNGGGATLRSYRLDPADWAESTGRARPLQAFLAFHGKLALYHEDADTIYVHAGVDTTIARMEDQDPQVLLWIREKFFRNAAAWPGKQIIFGHTPTLSLGLPAGQIFQSHRLYGIDTGCVYGGFLTAIDSRTHVLYQQPTDYYRG
jgi:serine/threonine protein phosphatase 1